MRTGYENTEENKIGNLTTFSRKVETTVKVISKTEAREVTSRRDLTTHRVADALVGDDTGSIYLTLWDEAIDEIEEGQILKLHNSYVKLFRGYMRLNIGRLGSYEIVEEAPFEDVNIDNNLSDKYHEPRYTRPYRGRRYSNRRRY